MLEQLIFGGGTVTVTDLEPQEEKAAQQPENN